MKKNIKFILVYFIIVILTFSCCVLKNYLEREIYNKHILEIKYIQQTNYIDITYLYSYYTYNVESFSLKMTDDNNNTINLGTYYLNEIRNYRSDFDKSDEGSINIRIDEQEKGFYITYSSNLNKTYSQSYSIDNIFQDYSKKTYQLTPMNKKTNDNSYLIMSIKSNSTNFYVYIIEEYN